MGESDTLTTPAVRARPRRRLTEVSGHSAPPGRHSRNAGATESGRPTRSAGSPPARSRTRMLSTALHT